MSRSLPGGTIAARVPEQVLMARLFTALALPEDVVAHLAAAVAEVREQLPAGARWIPPERWHLTMKFHGEDDPDRRAAKLRRRARGLPAPTLRLAACGTFSGVLWVGVRTADEDSRRALRRVAQAAGNDPREFRPHLTVARWSAGRPDRAALRALLADYTGPWWTPGELVLVRSELRPGGPRYTDLAHVALDVARGA
ncbi:RNA 2',3'-cyclic phosphodiesterase [Gandjariella thermophila]|uniref:RNA 2',3'-cyclic phosphodiesterase n=1 Tax=Gandjariella thermophila TaxID=1931992 RepID=A0A4D4J9I7_9PSEU|nr:RNA 2',3'-cyclic phosphodiesterase [Gandjariella thermophila]GDY30513.1 RNA 2',3'-cyclic phosphodiesterase [Gandjariella thermophila]